MIISFVYITIDLDFLLSMFVTNHFSSIIDINNFLLDIFMFSEFKYIVLTPFHFHYDMDLVIVVLLPTFQTMARCFHGTS